LTMQLKYLFASTLLLTVVIAMPTPFLPGLGGGGGGGGMAMPMSGMPGDPLEAFSSMEDRLLGNKSH
ncbi:hypothetical protein FBU30_011321, partial [Linnemannia zychae]